MHLNKIGLGFKLVDEWMVDWEAHLSIQQKRKIKSELDRYLNEQLYPPKKDFDILELWKILHAPPLNAEIISEPASMMSPSELSLVSKRGYYPG